MNGKRRTIGIAVALGVVLLFAGPGWSLRMTALGNNPVKDPTRRWPAGTVDLANLKSRLGYWERYEHVFLYRCKDTAEFNDALKTFAAIDANMLELVVHNGPKYSFALQDNNEELAIEDNRLDWTFTVWSPESWDRLYSRSRRRVSPTNLNFGKPVAPPRIDVYIGAGALRWEKVKVPDNIVVTNKRPCSVSPEFAGKGLIRATVFDMATKKPIAGAEVVLLKRDDQMEYKQIKRAKTDEKGACQIAQIPTGFYQVQVHADGYAARIQSNWNNDLPEYLKFKISLARPECVKGIVLDEAGKPVSGVKVSVRQVLSADGSGYSCAGNPSSTTDNLGRFNICSLPKGLISIRCQPTTLHLKNPASEQYPVPSDNIKLIVTGTATIWGKVVDKDGKRPPGGIILKLEPDKGKNPGTWGGSWTLSADGSFKMTGIPPGRYVISTHPNPGSTKFEPSAEKITVRAGKTYEMEVLHEDIRDKVMIKVRKFIERKLQDDR